MRARAHTSQVHRPQYMSFVSIASQRRRGAGLRRDRRCAGLAGLTRKARPDAAGRAARHSGKGTSQILIRRIGGRCDVDRRDSEATHLTRLTMRQANVREGCWQAEADGIEAKITLKLAASTRPLYPRQSGLSRRFHGPLS
jgi:hypothetical protein